MDFRVTEERQVTPEEYQLLGYGGDLGSFRLRFEGDEFLPSEAVAHSLYDVVRPNIDDAATAAFAFARPRRVNISFDGWQHGSIELLVTVGVVGGGLIAFFKDYEKFREGVTTFIDDLRRHGPSILQEAKKLLERRRL